MVDKHHDVLKDEALTQVAGGHDELVNPLHLDPNTPVVLTDDGWVPGDNNTSHAPLPLFKDVAPHVDVPDEPVDAEAATNYGKGWGREW